MPLKRDEGQQFVGIEIQFNRFGLVFAAPAFVDLPPQFSSFAPLTTKKAGFTGVIHRINTYIVPDDRKRMVLRQAVRAFSEWHGFAFEVLRR